MQFKKKEYKNTNAATGYVKLVIFRNHDRKEKINP